MPARMNSLWPQASLARIRAEFEKELLSATDEEIMAAASDLGMNPAMRGSAAFAGLKYPISARALRSFFSMQADSPDEAGAQTSTDAPLRRAPVTKPRKDHDGE
jgi:hypothetical protein